MSDIADDLAPAAGGPAPAVRRPDASPAPAVRRAETSAPVARRAVPDDAAELVRLRGVMLAECDGKPPADGPWQQATVQELRTRLAAPEEEATLSAYVVDRPAPDQGLAACAVSTIERRLGDPANPTGQFGYVFNVATDPDQRRRGLSRACMVAVLDWLRRRGVGKVDLKATEAGAPLYRSLGFRDSWQQTPMRSFLDRPGETAD